MPSPYHPAPYDRATSKRLAFDIEMLEAAWKRWARDAFDPLAIAALPLALRPKFTCHGEERVARIHQMTADVLAFHPQLARRIVGSHLIALLADPRRYYYQHKAATAKTPKTRSQFQALALAFPLNPPPPVMFDIFSRTR